MRNQGMWWAVALTALVLGGSAQAAPGGNAAGNQGNTGGKPKTEQPARHTDRTDQGRSDEMRAETQGKGDATSAEMQARKEERKEIQDQYRSGEQKGDQAGKKPWWKFWESDPA